MIYPIVLYGDPILKKRAVEIERGSLDVKQLSEDMFETMNNVTGDLVCTYAVGKRSHLIDNVKGE